MNSRGSVEGVMLIVGSALATSAIYQTITPEEVRDLSKLAVVFLLATLVQWAVVADAIEGIHPLKALLRAVITGAAAVAAIALLYPAFEVAIPGLKNALTVQVGLSIAVGLAGDGVVRKVLLERLFRQPSEKKGDDKDG